MRALEKEFDYRNVSLMVLHINYDSNKYSCGIIKVKFRIANSFYLYLQELFVNTL